VWGCVCGRVWGTGMCGAAGKGGLAGGNFGLGLTEADALQQRLMQVAQCRRTQHPMQ